MRINDLLFESEIADKLNQDLMDLILVFKQSPHDEIKIVDAINYLKNLGHTIDKSTILDVLGDDFFNEVIERSDDKVIKLKSNEPESIVAPDEKELSQEKVDRTAAKVATKAVQSQENV